jgi:hypothetical protein
MQHKKVQIYKIGTLNKNKNNRVIVRKSYVNEVLGQRPYTLSNIGTLIIECRRLPYNQL